MKTTLHPDFQAFLELLNETGVEYLVIGGVAVIAHGHFRSTKDLDIWVRPEPENAKRVLKAVNLFYGTDKGIDLNTFLMPRKIFFMGREPYRIDVMNTIPGVQFEQCHPKSITVDLGGVSVPLIDVWSLIKNKRATGRTQDISDAEKLEALHNETP